MDVRKRSGSPVSISFERSAINPIPFYDRSMKMSTITNSKRDRSLRVSKQNLPSIRNSFPTTVRIKNIIEKAKK